MSEQANNPFSDQTIPHPDENPNPLLRVGFDGVVLYANPSGVLLLTKIDSGINKSLPLNWLEKIKIVCTSMQATALEMQAAEKIYYINIIPIPENKWLNIYCNDITVWKETISRIDGQKVLSVILKDFNEKNINQIKLKESEAKYKSLVEHSQDFIYSVDAHGKFKYLNPVGLKKIGYKEEEIIGKHFSVLIDKEWKSEVVNFYQNQYESGIRETYLEFPVRSKDGQEWWLGQNVMLIKENNLINSFQVYARDITERKKTEEELKKQQALTNTILDNLPISIFIKNREGKYLFVNKYGLREAMLEKGEVEGKSAWEVFNEDFANTVSRTDQMAWMNKHFVSEEKSYNNVGEEIYLIVGKMILYSDQYKDPLLMGYNIDITESKKSEAELLKAKLKAEESMMAKERFISIMSHEIRTPMNAVVGITNLLLQQDKYPELKEYFNALKISSENLLKILNNVLDLSKIESDKIIFEEIDFNLPELVGKVKDLFSFLAAEKNIQLESIISPGVPELVKGDSHKLNQVLVNLMSNAVKFTEEGKVILSVELLEKSEESVHLLFSISDTGIGIPEEMQSIVFESFTQGDSNITRKYGGTGLGLTITKRLIELQNGSIKVDSEINKGSKFSFDLKFSLSKSKPLAEFKETDLVTLAGLNALVVEDNKMNQLVVSRFLEREGVSSELADNGLMALEFLKKNKFDIILMDLQMPEMDGYETATYIRKTLRMKEIPIIALTASASINIENKVLEAGMNDYIIKPFEPSAFYSIIAKYTNRVGATSKQFKIMSQGTKVIDLTYLNDASAGNPDFIREMIEIFLKQTPHYLSQLKNYYKDKEWPEFRKIMHKLKPTVTMMGMKKGDIIVKEIESMVKHQINLDQIGTLLEKLQNICEESYVELKEELNS